MKVGTSGSTAGKALDQTLSSISQAGQGTLGDLSKAQTLAHLRVAELQVGEYTGTGAAQDVLLDFDPLFVAVFNLTDGTMCGWAVNTVNRASKSYRQSAALGLVAATTGVIFGAAGAQKFSLAGADAIVNINGKVYQYVAFGA